MRKAECIAWIITGLNDPASVQTAIQTLEPWEQNVLAILKTFGNQIESEILNIAVRATGVKLPPRMNTSRWGRQRAFIEALFRRGLILSAGYSPGYFHGYASDRVYTDQRLTAAAPSLVVAPFDFEPLVTPKQTIYRRPPTVALYIIGLLQAIQDLGGLGLTKAGDLRVAAVKKLRKAMQWPEKGIEIDGLFFPDPATAWINAFRHSDLLVATPGLLKLRESPAQFAERSYAEQIQFLLDGFLRSNAWAETRSIQRGYIAPKNYGQGRQALLIGLQSLPPGSDKFFSMDDFELGLFERIGEHFSLSYLKTRPTFRRDTPAAEQKQALAEWQFELRENWLAQERPWISTALKTWAYFLGLVELALDGNTLQGFRLTSLGKEVLYPDYTAAATEMLHSPEIDAAAWVVQPNFDVIAYLERISAPQLAFLERFATRKKAGQHTALFRLTRHSVYRGLESGTSLDDLLDGLSRGAQAEIPQNVDIEIREWAALREQISLRHRTRIVEFPNEAVLKATCQNGLQGKVIGKRFLLLSGKMPKSKLTGYQRKNYAQALPPCLSISEQGQIHIQKGYHDLWIAAQLDQWAVRTTDGWQLTADSVRSAHQAGKRLSNFLSLLAGRLKSPLPKLTRLALWAWIGQPQYAELGSAVILRCPDAKVYAAVTSSRQLRPSIQGELTHNTLLINPDDLEQVTEILNWAGLKISAEFEVRIS